MVVKAKYCTQCQENQALGHLLYLDNTAAPACPTMGDSLPQLLFHSSLSVLLMFCPHLDYVQIALCPLGLSTHHQFLHWFQESLNETVPSPPTTITRLLWHHDWPSIIRPFVI